MRHDTISVTILTSKKIRNFVEAQFAEIRRSHPLWQHLPSQWPSRDSVSAIVERSSGHFIYASTVIRFIQSPRHRPDDRLQVILGLKQPYKQGRPYAALDLLYTLIFGEIQDPSQLEMIQRVLGIIYLRNQNVGLFIRSQTSTTDGYIEQLLELRPGDLILLFDPLRSLLNFDNGYIRIFHKSLFDYLLDTSRSGDFQLDLGLAHESIANYILRWRKILDRLGDSSLTDASSLASSLGNDFRVLAYHCQFARLNESITFSGAQSRSYISQRMVA